MTESKSLFQALRRWLNWWRLPRFANDDEAADWFETHDIPDLPLANVSTFSTGSTGTLRPVLWCDFNVPADVAGGRAARADSWILNDGDTVKLEDDSGEGLVGKVIGQPWTGPSGTRYVRVVAE